MKLSLLPFVCTPDSKETHVSGWPDIPLSLPLIIHTSYSITRSAGYLQTPPPSGTEYSGNNHPRQPHLRPTPTLPFLSATHIKSVKNKIPTKNKKQVRRFRNSTESGSWAGNRGGKCSVPEPIYRPNFIILAQESAAYRQSESVLLFIYITMNVSGGVLVSSFFKN